MTDSADVEAAIDHARDLVADGHSPIVAADLAAEQRDLDRGGFMRTLKAIREEVGDGD